MSLDDLTAQSGGWESHPDNPVGGRSSSSSSSGGRSRSFRKGDPCPICDQADKRCSLTEQGLYRCWNFRAEGDRPDFAWSFRKVATSSYGGEWGCWTKASHCDRCGTKDSRCWKNDQGIFYCANSLQGLGDAGSWQFLGQSNGKKGQLWGKWRPEGSPLGGKSTNWVPQKLPTVKQVNRRIISPRPAEDPQPPSSATRSEATLLEPEQLLEPQVQGLWRPIHRWLWEQASPTLQGRFVDKLSIACIDDTSYSRYLQSENIEVILQTLDEQVASGEWSTELVLAGGWFSENKGFESTFRFKTSLRPGRVIACFDIEGQFDQLRANPEVPLVKRKRIKGNKVKLQQIKYQQAAGIPTRPYFPKAAQQLRTHLQQTGSQYLLQITEGEDKAECMAQNFPTLLDGTPVLWVSMAGVWNFAGTDTDLHPELATLVDGAIGVGIAFDSDVQSKKEVRQAMERLASRIIERTDGQIIPLAADWRGLLGEQKQLATHTERWGLDDLWGVLTQAGSDPASAIDRLVSPRYARMVRRWWHRKGKAWNPENIPDLLSLEDARTAVRQTVRDWFSAGLSTLRSASSDRIALAATCGVGKTTATMQELVEHVQRWWFAQVDPIQFQQWSERLEDILNSEVSTPGALSYWLAAFNQVVQLAHDTFPAPGTLSEAANEVLLLHQKLTRLEVKKAASLPDTPERWAVLSEMRTVREQLESIYHQGLGGSLLLVFKDRKALFDSLADHVLPAASGDSQLPPWLALRTGREALE
ncbi:MAG: DUF3854 domain-containing protein, partial [Anaerolineae bacterium]|nr:DUF3854 domain-containing protein [Gloeobacterales cyanobacterium ES-bin-313]